MVTKHYDLVIMVKASSEASILNSFLLIIYDNIKPSGNLFFKLIPTQLMQSAVSTHENTET